MFDSQMVLDSWAAPYLQRVVSERGYRGIVGFRDVRVEACSEPDYGSYRPYSEMDMDSTFDTRAVVAISGIGYRESGSTVRVECLIDADEFSFERFLDEIQEIADEGQA